MIQVSKLGKSYSRDRAVLSDISFTLAKGEFAYVTGTSGSGKSTLLRLLYGAERPNNGTISINGVSVNRCSSFALAQLRSKLGLVFQDFKLLPERNIFENIALPLEIQGKGQTEISKRVQQSLHYVGLEQKVRTLPQQLSAGEQQRVAIARALVVDPVVLLADEPTGNIDPEHMAGILELFKGANARGTTILMATHDYSILRRSPRRTLHLVNGQLDNDISLESILQTERTHVGN
jgi:cell division transport system ATP-binding protein